MREICEFRIREKHAHLLSQPNAGRLLSSGIVRAITVPVGSPLFEEIRALDSRLRASQPVAGLFSFAMIMRKYTPREIESAELLQMFVLKVFEPAGEESGTQYDESTACSECGSGVRQVSDLFFDFRKIPRKCDIATTIAHEIIVSEHLAEILKKSRISGVEFGPVHHRALYEEDPFNLESTPSGRKIIEAGLREGRSPDAPDYYVWLNRLENKELLDAAEAERVARKRAKEAKSKKSWPKWYQLKVTSNTLPIAPGTRAGREVFDIADPTPKHGCPRGDNIGHWLLSEVYVKRSAWDGADIMLTRETTGISGGLIRPQPAILVSPRWRRVLVDHGIKGVAYDVAHFV